jgi:hypothetical protein
VLYRKLRYFFLGDQKDETAVLEWLLDADNRELDDAIEAVNEKMLVKLLEKTQFMAVFFCKCNKIIVLIQSTKSKKFLF